MEWHEKRDFKCKKNKLKSKDTPFQNQQIKQKPRVKNRHN